MKRTVLIVEDEPRIAHWLKVRFERAGFDAEVAHDGRAGLALALRTWSCGVDGRQPIRTVYGADGGSAARRANGLSRAAGVVASFAFLAASASAFSAGAQAPGTGPGGGR